jgi:hypothetical protein
VMKREWGIADDELRVLAPVSDGDRTNFVVFCDADGNGNLPFHEIAARFTEVAKAVYDLTRNCECEDGCLQCLRSWFSQSLGGNTTRQGAALFAASLLGLERLKTSPKPFAVAAVHSDLEQVRIKWNQHAKHLIIQGPGRFTNGISSRPDSMCQIFSDIHRTLRSFWCHSSPGLKLEIDGLPHLTEALRGLKRIEKGHNSFQRLAFELLRYPRIDV